MLHARLQVAFQIAQFVEQFAVHADRGDGEERPPEVAVDHRGVSEVSGQELKPGQHHAVNDQIDEGHRLDTHSAPRIQEADDQADHADNERDRPQQRVAQRRQDRRHIRRDVAHTRRDHLARNGIAIDLGRIHGVVVGVFHVVDHERERDRQPVGQQRGDERPPERCHHPPPHRATSSQ